MNSPSSPEDSMKTLMDAVAQVTSRPVPVLHCTYPQPTTNDHMIAPLPIQSTPIDMGGMFPNHGVPLRKRKRDSVLASETVAAAMTNTSTSVQEDDDKRSKRLEQNRLAAIESRRRKKFMVEELQRSVQYYSKANVTLKSQNAELERQLLMAKQKALINREGKDQLLKGTGYDAGYTTSGLQDSSEKEITPPPKELIPKAISSKQSVTDHSSRAYSALLGNASNAEMEKQAQQAQFAATQALYKSMGYPAGAARVAASTFSQFVGQTGTIPGHSAPDKKAPPPERVVGTAAAIPHPQVVNSSPLILANKNSSKIEPNDTSYIEALNRFAMQQAAAANAAAAAATAAIQAAYLHNQLRTNGGSSSTQAVPSMPFSYPASMPWSFQNQASFTKND